MFGPSRQRRHGDAAERADDGSSRRLSVAILGPGGVGGVLAAVLSRAGHDVVCIAHRETAQDIQRHGIGVTSEYFGTFTASTIRADVRLRDRVDVCIVAVKAYSLQPALRRVPPQDLGTALVVPFLNGIEHTGYLRRRYPAASVIAGTIRIESRRVAPTEIIHSSPFASIGLSVTGDRPGLLHRTRELASQLGFAGFPVEIARSESVLLWDKLSFLAPLALLTAAVMAPIGVVRTAHRQQLLSVVGEVAAVANGSGGRVASGDVVAALDKLPPEMTSSMQRDFAAGNRTELDAIGGAVVRAGSACGVELPQTEQIVRELSTRLTMTTRGVPEVRELPSED